MRHSLRYNDHDIDLPPGEFVIGRAASCQLSLDDPLVSRNHATLTVTPEAVVVADLGSRNGVRVNSDRIEGKRALTHGDQISIGNQDMTLLSRRELVADTLIQGPNSRASTFGLLGILADKALAMGRGEEAEKLLFELLDQLLVDAQRGVTITTETLERASEYALKLAIATSHGRWVDYIFRLHAAMGRMCAGPIVDELYTVLRKVKAVNLAVLREYLAGLHELSRHLGPADRFLLSRLEGLERLAAAK
ncbi:MAG TPA: FHA domain-containing protein [Polyangiaceae bacterium]|nr:FHA domain-containing protein [Polyangiaceae bacterium]